jgi:HPt (histidine-containing phosphotransfer) domain-containing protein
LESAPSKAQELAHHIEGKNQKAIGNLVHQLKPSINSVAVPELGQMIKMLEQTDAVGDNYFKQAQQFLDGYRQLSKELGEHPLASPLTT